MGLQRMQMPSAIVILLPTSRLAQILGMHRASLCGLVLLFEWLPTLIPWNSSFTELKSVRCRDWCCSNFWLNWAFFVFCQDILFSHLRKGINAKTRPDSY